MPSTLGGGGEARRPVRPAAVLESGAAVKARARRADVSGKTAERGGGVPYARVNGTMLYYREAGEGRLALFIHGFPLDHSMWLDQLAGLAHVRRCVAVDLRGFGRSDPVVEPTLSMEMLADDVAELIEALGVGLRPTWWACRWGATWPWPFGSCGPPWCAP